MCVSKSIGLAYSFCAMSLGSLYLEGLIHGGVYFRNFTVSCIVRQSSKKTLPEGRV